MRVTGDPQSAIRALGSLAVDLPRCASVTDVTGALQSSLSRALGAAHVVVALPDGEGRLRPVKRVGVAGPDPCAGGRHGIEPSAAPFATAALDGHERWAGDAAGRPSASARTDSREAPAGLCALPLRDGDRVLGVLVVRRQEPRGFDDADRDLLHVAAALAAAACVRLLGSTPGGAPPDARRAGALSLREVSRSDASVAFLGRDDGARCSHHVADEGLGHAFVTVVDADPSLGPRSLDAVDGVLELARRQQAPPALVGQSIAAISASLDGPVTGAHIELCSSSGWLAVAPLDHAVVVLTSGGGAGSVAPATADHPAGERVVVAGRFASTVVAVTLAPGTDAPRAGQVRQLAVAGLGAAPDGPASDVARALLDLVDGSTVEPLVRGAVVVCLPPARVATVRRRVLPSRPVASAIARHFAVAAVGDAATEDVHDRVALVTAELVSNAVRHAYESLELVVRIDGGCVEVSVSDDDDRTPEFRARADAVEHGRGMTLVEALSEQVGVRPRQGGGKVVWARVSLAS